MPWNGVTKDGLTRGLLIEAGARTSARAKFPAVGKSGEPRGWGRTWAPEPEDAARAPGYVAGFEANKGIVGFILPSYHSGIVGRLGVRPEEAWVWSAVEVNTLNSEISSKFAFPAINTKDLFAAKDAGGVGGDGHLAQLLMLPRLHAAVALTLYPLGLVSPSPLLQKSRVGTGFWDQCPQCHLATVSYIAWQLLGIIHT